MANNQLREDLILNTSQFDAKIASVNAKIVELSKKGKNMGGGFNSSMGNMIGSVGKFNSKLTGAIGTIGKFAGVAGGLAAGVSLADWFANTTAKAVELAREAEGVRLAFERLNKPNLLDNLRQATHNTVTDVELMKQAVKFKDFNLNIEQMGTLLAFAQQKAKDTGESVDYMVNSIVTGLGRQSLMILDNLGISAAEVKAQMKGTGDMTKAVAEIIKKKMAESGEYVETAADRAKQKEVELQNALEELGRTFGKGQSAAGDFFHEIEMGAISALSWVGKLLNNFTELGRIANNYENMGGSKKVDSMLSMLGDPSKSKKDREKAEKTYERQLKEFARKEKQYQDRINANPYNQAAKEQLAAVKQMKGEYIRRANYVFNPVKTTPTPTPTGKTGKGKVYPENSVGWYDQQISKLKEKIKVQVDPTAVKELNKELEELERKKRNLEAGFTPLAADKKLNVTDLIGGNATLNQTPQPLKKTDVSTGITAGTIYDYYNSKKDSVNNVMETLDMGLIGKEQAQEYIDAINAELESLGLKPIKVKVEADGVEKAMHGIESIGSALSSMGSALEMPELDVLGTIGQAIANVALGYSEANKQAASLGPWAWIAFAAAGLAQMMAVIASIKSATSGYANGGIIGGSSYAGDNLIARVNSGEMILNSQQQRNLFNLLDNGGGIGGAGQVEFVLKGSDLYGSMRNYSRVKSLSGINTGIK